MARGYGGVSSLEYSMNKSKIIKGEELIKSIWQTINGQETKQEHFIIEHEERVL
jgi:hypothetical protein